MLEPTYKQEFSIKADMLKLDETQIPQWDTIDIMAELATIKDKVNSPSSVPKKRGEVCLMLM